MCCVNLTFYGKVYILVVLMEGVAHLHPHVYA